MAFTNKEVFNNLIADSNQFCSDSEDFQPNFIEHSVRPMAVRIDFEEKKILTRCQTNYHFFSLFLFEQTERLYKRILYGIEKSTENEAYKNELQNYAQAAFNVI